MKKQTAIVLLAALCLSLCGCAAFERPLPTPKHNPDPTPPAVTEAPAVSAPPEQTPAAPSASAPVIVSVSRTELEAMDPRSGETRILCFSYDAPSVVIEGRPEASAAINNYLSLLTEAYYTGENYGDGYGTGYNNMLTMAEDNYNYMVESGSASWNVEMTADRRALVVRNDGRVLSLVLNDYSYAGGAHGGVITRAFCFDAETGALLGIDSLSADREGFTAALTRAMGDMVRQDSELSARIDLVPEAGLDAALAALVRDGSWYFDYSGMVLFSDDYEISSHASGPVSFRIPYSELSDWLEPRLIPAAETEGGSLSVRRAEELPAGSVGILDKVEADRDGAAVYLVADGTLRDVTLTRVEYTGSFFETAQLWSCSEMKDCALQLAVMIPDGMPNLKISYRGRDGVSSLYLTESGENGSLILLDGDSIEAVG